MSFLRPATRDLLSRWAEPASAATLALLGLWALSAGGYFFTPLGLAIVALGLLWAMIALRRLRFLRPVDAPGMVEVVEGEVSYLGPTFGGTLALEDLAEVRLIAMAKRLSWRLRSTTGQVLVVPADAAGAERLHDAFASLPYVDMASLSHALARGETTGPLWQRARTSPVLRP